MPEQEAEHMRKEVVTKEDGRRLIYYRFEPATPSREPEPAQGEHQA